MPDLVEQMYCSQQIFIPPNLPSILKKYAKAAIRTQPSDLLTWSSAYFRALADGIPPPAKDRIEYPPFDSPSGLTPGFLKVLVNQIGMAEVVSKDVLAERWKGVCLNLKALQDLLDVGMFEDEVHWLEFFAICVGTLEPSLTRTMIHICELLTDEPEGGRAAIPVSLFINMYKYLARLDCGPVNNLEQYELMKKADSEATCDAISAPHEEEANSEVPNIDWDTAIEKDPSEAGSASKQDGVESAADTAGEDEGIGEEIIGSDKDNTDGESTRDGGSALVEGEVDQLSDSEILKAELVEGVEIQIRPVELLQSSDEMNNGGEDGEVSSKQDPEDEEPGSVEPTVDDAAVGTNDVGKEPLDGDRHETPDISEDQVESGSPNGEITDNPMADLADAEDSLNPGLSTNLLDTVPGTVEEVSIKDKEDLLELDNSEGPTMDSKQDATESQDGEETRPPTVVENPLIDNNDGDDKEDHVNDTNSIGMSCTEEGNDNSATDEVATLISKEEQAEEKESQRAVKLCKNEDLQETAQNFIGTEPTQNLGLAYIIDDDGTLSAAPLPDGDNEALKERDSEKTVDTHLSDDGMMVWPDIKLQEEGNTSEEPIIEKELLSADGIEVFTDVEPQMTQDNIVVTQELSPNHAPPEVSDQEDNIFAPHIDSITGLLEAESAPLEEISSEEFAAVVKECASEEDVLLTTNVIDPGKDTSDMEGTPQASEDITQSREQTVTSPQKLEKPSARREIDIQSLVKKDSEIMLLPTPVTSDVMLYMENTCNRNGFKISPTQQLTNKMSMVDVQVAVPMDETIEEVYEQHKYPKWMHIPGIGPIVPDHIIEEAEKYFLSVSKLQEGMIMPRNIRHFHCPPLELLPDCPDKTL